MSMILDEDDYERMAAHQRAASRAAVSRADENEKLKERIKELEAEVKRWKPKRPTDEASENWRNVIAITNDFNCFRMHWDARRLEWHYSPSTGDSRQGKVIECVAVYFDFPTEDELKQIGGAK